jgi:hypothetical protein
MPRKRERCFTITIPPAAPPPYAVTVPVSHGDSSHLVVEAWAGDQGGNEAASLGALFVFDGTLTAVQAAAMVSGSAGVVDCIFTIPTGGSPVESQLEDDCRALTVLFLAGNPTANYSAVTVKLRELF